ncbi:recombinase family protein [Tenacibaculum aestuarii]|uniref:recombinase family protein n=1 Tax=Tenacibaculum aestuarii TaxID=362781 RepID=UPI003894BC7A
MKYISYYRVSSIKQGNSGLGLEAQKSAVSHFLNSSDKLLFEYQEVESAKLDKRPELLRAIQHCKNENATLLIAKLDRLSRNVQFIYMLKESNVNFVCADMPDANSLTIGILAVLAQEERELISKRTKLALTELRKKGVKLGSPQNLTIQARQKGTEAIKQNALNNPQNKMATLAIVGMRENQKFSYRKIAKQLNENGYKTRRGKEFTASQVLILYDRYKTHSLAINL